MPAAPTMPDDESPAMAIDVGVMGDFGGWPLWTDEESTQSPEEWPMLSDNLKAGLEEWNLAWTATSARNRSTKTVRQLVAEAQALVEDVQLVLGSAFNVRLDL